MKEPADGRVTELLVDWASGDQRALSELLPLVYGELRRLADRQLRAERQNHTLQRTALVHEAYLRLINQKNVNWQGRAHFIGLAAQLMRRILIDHARARRRAKRGGGISPLRLEQTGVILGSCDEESARVEALEFAQDPTVDLSAIVHRSSQHRGHTRKDATLVRASRDLSPGSSILRVTEHPSEGRRSWNALTSPFATR